MNPIVRHITAAVSLLCFTLCVSAQTSPGAVVYKVKKKDTVFSIAHRHGLSVEALMDANPSMRTPSWRLLAGDTLLLPAPSAEGQVIRVGVMLPLHDVDGDGRRMTEYYRGLLLACDSLRRAGISTDIHAWNVDADADISVTLRDPAAARCQIIFGPLYSTQVHALATFCQARGIRLVIPFSISGDDVSHCPVVSQVWQSPDRLTNAAIHAFNSRFKDWHTVIIDCHDATSDKGVFTASLRNSLAHSGRSCSLTSLTSSETQFRQAFSATKPNVVVLNSGKAPELSIAVQKLRSLKALQPTVRVALFGYTEWLLYTRQRLADFFALDTYIPATFYYNAADARTQQLEAAYRRWFHSDMLYAFPRFALTGYDHAQYFLRALAAGGTKRHARGGQGSLRPLQTPLVFRQVDGGGKQNVFFHLIHYTPAQTIESLAY